MPAEIYTIGHSNQSTEELIGLLAAMKITAVGDVRSAPYSRFNPQFNRETLAESLKARGIAYVFLGRELGARSEDADCYVNGRVSFEKLSMTRIFQTGIERVVSGAKTHIISLMCAEREPLSCHRSLLVSPALAEAGLKVSHILGRGELESHDAMLDRLLQLQNMPATDLFRSREESVKDACERHEERIAYRRNFKDDGRSID